MAVVVLSESTELKDQGVRSVRKIEWVKVVAAASLTSEGAAYPFKKIRSCVGAVGAGAFSVAVNNAAKTATITPLVTVSGTYFIGLIEG